MAGQFDRSLSLYYLGVDPQTGYPTVAHGNFETLLCNFPKRKFGEKPGAESDEKSHDQSINEKGLGDRHTFEQLI